jgi:hypothetical protein
VAQTRFAMNTLNKLLARLGYQLTRSDAVAEQSELQMKYAALEVAADELREQNKELKRKLACRTSGEWYWKKKAQRAREVIE